MNEPTRDIPADAEFQAAMAQSSWGATTESDRREHAETLEDSFPRPFGRYQLRRQLGQGGMATVFLAYDSQLDRLVALKAPHRREQGDANWKTRFMAEAKLAATHRHPHICPVYEVGEVESQPYLTMAYIEGESLAEFLKRRGPPPLEQAIAWMLKIIDAIADAHERGVVHRDIKPANVLLDVRGEPIVTDFGLAIRVSSESSLRLTKTGVVIGTPNYMAPEQIACDHQSIGPATDVYALGAMLYELLAGAPPFVGTSMGDLFAQIERDEPQPLQAKNSGISAELNRVILKSLAKRPADRFSSAREFGAAIAHALVAPTAKVETPPTSQWTAKQAPDVVSVNPPRPKRLALALGLAMLAALIAAMVIYVQTNFGTLVVELSDPEAKVKLSVNGETVRLQDETRSVRLRAGKNQLLEVSGDGFESESQTFELKRGATTTARVTLRPTTAAVAVANAPSNSPGSEKNARTTKKSPPAEVKFPAAPVSIIASEWELFLDANLKDMRAWLGERRKDQHSVMWVDAVNVGARPLFAALAARNDRVPKWNCHLDIDARAFNQGMIPPQIDSKRESCIALSGYVDGDVVRSVSLWHPRENGWIILPDLPDPKKEEFFEFAVGNGCNLRRLRPFPIPSGITLSGVYFERSLSAPTEHVVHRPIAELEQYLRTTADESRELVSFAIYPQGGELKFAAVVSPPNAPTRWKLDWQVSPRDIKSQHETRLSEGFEPAQITICPWNEQVSYAVLYRKTPKATSNDGDRK